MLPLPGHPSGHSQFDNWHVLQGPATTVGSSTSLTREQVVGVALCDQLLELLIYNLVFGFPGSPCFEGKPGANKEAQRALFIPRSFANDRAISGRRVGSFLGC